MNLPLGLRILSRVWDYMHFQKISGNALISGIVHHNFHDFSYVWGNSPVAITAQTPLFYQPNLFEGNQNVN